MNSSQLISHVSDDTGVTQKRVKIILASILANIQVSVDSDDDVRLIGFGTFSLNRRKERPGRNPSTGETITIPAKNAVKFKAGSEFNATINQGK